MSDHHGSYYVPDSSYWPIIGSVGLVTTVIGVVNCLHHGWFGPYVLVLGGLILLTMMTGWFGAVIRENQRGLYDEQVDRSFRWGMVWFIFSEVCFFAVFFGALFYSRYWVIPNLGDGTYGLTHYLLWPDFQAKWPLLINPDNTQFVGARSVLSPWGLPAINTLILLTSGMTLTWAHWALKRGNRRYLQLGLGLTILLGLTFLGCQATEYMEAYRELSLTLNAGIYGTTFFMLTGFHGLHVTIGTIMLCVVFGRCLVGHFTPDDHFAFEGVAWYWHFVDVVWLFLFIFVYWL